ncbi:FecR family protein [Pedobacter ginsengisoli]|uniref:FecR family protein n=1 Tax=Pedobacter ginsengisoli TaxID=363852 RepID=UPI002550FD60|nr:FecR family protein [Pedobacter ginsengisoli]
MKEAKALIEKYKAGTCTPEEMRLIDKWLLETHMGERSELSAEDFEQISREVWLNVLAEREQKSAKQVKLWPGFRIKPGMTGLIAAAAVAAITLGTWMYMNEVASSRKAPRNDVAQNDIAPGKNGATITLANGKVIELSDAKSGVVVGGEKGLVYDDGTEVASSRNAPRNDDQLNPSSLRGGDPSLRSGQAAQPHDEIASIPRNDGQGVNGKGGEAGATAQMLTASTAKGQTYQFTLPDGTKVWLNADSKLEFPSNFVNSKTRNVKLTGEGYFEVATSYTSLQEPVAKSLRAPVAKSLREPVANSFRERRAKQSFIVQTAALPGRGSQTVEVLGTHFNINAYADGGTNKTTLLEGSVAINDKVLKPGQEAELTGRRLIISQVDPEQAVAWKDGLFIYNATPLEDVMRQVARWYNVEIAYEKESLRKVPLGGTVSRYDHVSRILNTLENTGAVKFRLNGRKITVSE